MDGSSLWGVINIVGPLLLGAVLLWAVLNNRRSRAEKRRTEEATRERYEQTDRDAKAEERRNG